MTLAPSRATDLPVSDADPFSHEVLEDPLPMHEQLREAGPVVYLSRYDVYALARYEQGVALLRACHAQLEAAEQRILLLTSVEADGRPALAPFRHEASVRK